MMYDIAADEGFPGAPEKFFVREHYDAVIDAAKHAQVPLDKLVVGFEPRVPQAYTGVWAGFERDYDTMTYLYGQGVGGVMWWAMNDALGGENAVQLAHYVATNLA